MTNSFAGVTAPVFYLLIILYLRMLISRAIYPFSIPMDLFKFPRIHIFSIEELNYYSSFEDQIEEEDPFLLDRFIDCVR